jgi:hypothetical protein
VTGVRGAAVATRGIGDILRLGERQIGYNGHFDNVL